VCFSGFPGRGVLADPTEHLFGELIQWQGGPVAQELRKITSRAPVGQRLPNEHVAIWPRQRYLPPAARVDVMVATRQRNDPHVVRARKRYSSYPAAGVVDNDISTVAVDVPRWSRCRLWATPT
jgi:hypothetical protein